MKKLDGRLAGIGKTGRTVTIGIGKMLGALGAFAVARKGINMVRDALDGAITRYDTLNQFPKVMKQMGFSAKKSQGAINKLSDGIEGLPTTLDSVAKTTQRIAVMTGDLDGAVDTTLALNNAFIASGASQEDASRGLDQYVQMLSKGEVDLESWRTLQETMGVALNETAKAFGFTGKSAQNDLYAALKSGKITFDQFNDKIIELSNKTGGFADIARKASGGIRTSWTNMKTAIVKGVTDVIGAIDKSLGGTGSIEKILDRMKDGFKAFFAKVSEGIPTLIGGIKSVYNFLKPFLPLIKAIVLGFAGFLATVGIMNTVSAAIAGVRAAIKWLGAVVLENPFALVIVGIALAVAAFKKMWDASQKLRDTLSSAWDAISAIFKAAFEPIGPLLGQLGQAFQGLVGIFSSGGGKVTLSWKSIGDTVAGIVQSFVQKIFPTLSKIFVGVSNVIQGAIKLAIKILQQLTAWWFTNGPAIINAVKKTFNTVSEIVSSVISAVASFVGAQLTKIKSFWNKNGDQIMQAAKNIWTVVWNTIKTIMSLVLGVIKTVWPIVVKLTKTAWKTVKGVISGAIDIILGIIKVFASLFTGDWKGVWEGIKKILRGALKIVKSLVSGGFGAVRDIATSLWSKIKDKVSEMAGKMKKNISDRFHDIVESAKALPGKIGSGIKKMAGKAADGARHAAIFVARKFAGGLNKVIGGANTVLDFLHIKNIPTVPVPEYARGTRGHPGGPAIVNDGAGPELIRTPDGRMGMAPGRNALVNLPKGSEVFPAAMTKQLLAAGVPAYKGGIFDKVKGLASKAFDYFTNPGKLLTKIYDKVGAVLPKMSGVAADIAKGGFKKVKSGIASWVKKKLDAFGFGGGAVPNVKGGAAAWRHIILKAAAVMRESITPAQVNGIIAQIQRESGGNQRIVQSSSVVDINTLHGNPARGLLQYIPQTFRAYAVKGHNNIYSGYDQLLAFFNNTNWRKDLPYGRRGWGPTGKRKYATGGFVPSTRMAWVGERGPELLRLPGGSRVYNHRQSMAMASGEKSPQRGGITQNITINSPTPLSPSETAREQRKASRKLALEWGL